MLGILYILLNFIIAHFICCFVLALVCLAIFSPKKNHMQCDQYNKEKANIILEVKHQVTTT